MTPVNTIHPGQASRLASLEAMGIAPYPHCYAPTHVTAELCSLAEDGLTIPIVRAAGRIAAIRMHRRTAFLDLEDGSGIIQVAIAVERFADLLSLLNAGDLVGVEGVLRRSGTGEPTVFVDSVTFLAGCLHPLPDKARGLLDPGQERRRRHLHLLSDSEARGLFRLRARLVRHLREELWSLGFEEHQTPVLDTAYGGAEAEPFVTDCLALDNSVYLRISPELNLKRLIVGGLERVFEIGPQFRNENLSAKHHPEFTTLEIYQAHADYHDMMNLTERLLVTAAERLLGTRRILSRLGKTPVEIDLTPPFRRLPMLEGIQEITGMDLADADASEARALAAELGVTVGEEASADEVVMAIFEARVESTLDRPTFVIDYPASLCPLTKSHRSNPRLAERFELYLHGLEFANAYSELTDPREQRRQFEAQAARRAVGDSLAHLPDWPFVEALEYGMPPTGGLGIGIDRLTMLFTGAAHIQDVILFPLHRSGIQEPATASPSPAGVREG